MLTAVVKSHALLFFFFFFFFLSLPTASSSSTDLSSRLRFFSFLSFFAFVWAAESGSCNSSSGSSDNYRDITSFDIELGDEELHLSSNHNPALLFGLIFTPHWLSFVVFVVVQIHRQFVGWY